MGVCIDQKDIQRDLACLPVWLSACNGFLIASGVTYTSRLWCCLEMYVYSQMASTDSEAPSILGIGKEEADQVLMQHQWRSFDVRKCECVDERDKERILRVISQFPDGMDSFNDY